MVNVPCDLINYLAVLQLRVEDIPVVAWIHAHRGRIPPSSFKTGVSRHKVKESLLRLSALGIDVKSRIIDLTPLWRMLYKFGSRPSEKYFGCPMPYVKLGKWIWSNDLSPERRGLLAAVVASQRRQESGQQLSVSVFASNLGVSHGGLHKAVPNLRNLGYIDTEVRKIVGVKKFLYYKPGPKLLLALESNKPEKETKKVDKDAAINRLIDINNNLKVQISELQAEIEALKEAAANVDAEITMTKASKIDEDMEFECERLGIEPQRFEEVANFAETAKAAYPEIVRRLELPVCAPMVTLLKIIKKDDPVSAFNRVNNEISRASFLLSAKIPDSNLGPYVANWLAHISKHEVLSWLLPENA